MQVGVAGVPDFHHLQALVDLAAQLGTGAVLADEDRADHAAHLLQGLIGGVLGAAAAIEPAQHPLGLGGAQP